MYAQRVHDLREQVAALVKVTDFFDGRVVDGPTVANLQAEYRIAQALRDTIVAAGLERRKGAGGKIIPLKIEVRVW